MFQVDEYNVDLYPADTIDHNTGEVYHLLIISKFRDETEIERKTFYVRQGKNNTEEANIEHLLHNKNDIKNTMMYPNNAKLSLVGEKTLLRLA